MDDTSLLDDVREVVTELDPDGGGYRTREGTDTLFAKLGRMGWTDRAGKLLAKPAKVMRMGCAVAMKSYKPERRAIAAMAVQTDLMEAAPDEGRHQWLHRVAALDETEDAIRKTLLYLTLPEILGVIALKRQKAAEAWAIAERLQDIVDNHPHWKDAPHLTVADILGARE